MFDKINNSSASNIEINAILIVALVIKYIMSGRVLATLWAWFIIPVFQFPAISYVQAISQSL